MTDWTFRRRHGACGACARRFDDGERHASSLAIVGEDLRRDDLCEACWAARPASGDLFHWFTRHREGKRGLQLDLGTLEQLFVRLEDRAEARVRELRYVLALLLLRKRRLKLDRILRDEGGEAMLVHRPRRPESFRVLVYDFTPERMQALRADLVLLLEGAEPGAREGESPPAGGPDGGSDSVEEDADGDRVLAPVGGEVP
jgi:hypothetical protein